MKYLVPVVQVLNLFFTLIWLAILIKRANDNKYKAARDFAAIVLVVTNVALLIYLLISR